MNHGNFLIKGGGEGIPCGKCRSGTSQGKTFGRGTYRVFPENGRGEIIQKGAAGCRSACRAGRPALSKAGMPPWHQEDRKAPAGQNAEGKRAGRAGSDVKIPKKWNGPSAGRQKPEGPFRRMSNQTEETYQSANLGCRKMSRADVHAHPRLRFAFFTSPPLSVD